MLPNKELFEKNGVLYYSNIKTNSSDIYLKIREKEGRIYSDNEVKILPYFDKHPEWKLRLKSTKRFCKYIKKKKQPLNILDIGCGNGWFSNQMAKIRDTKVVGLDINIPELEQAKRVFKKENLAFIYADIFDEVSFGGFDIISLNGCIQYFPDLNKLIKKLMGQLDDKGEIHIIDSPFYKKEEIGLAKERTLKYFSKIGFPQMANNYFHHSIQNITEFKTMYKPNFIIQKLTRVNDSPFMWVRIN